MYIYNIYISYFLLNTNQEINKSIYIYILFFHSFGIWHYLNRFETIHELNCSTKMKWNTSVQTKKHSQCLIIPRCSSSKSTTTCGIIGIRWNHDTSCLSYWEPNVQLWMDPNKKSTMGVNFINTKLYTKIFNHIDISYLPCFSDVFKKSSNFWIFQNLII